MNVIPVEKFIFFVWLNCSKMCTWNDSGHCLGNEISSVCKWIPWWVHIICK